MDHDPDLLDTIPPLGNVQEACSTYPTQETHPRCMEITRLPPGSMGETIKIRKTSTLHGRYTLNGNRWPFRGEHNSKQKNMYPQPSAKGRGGAGGVRQLLDYILTNSLVLISSGWVVKT